MIAAGAITAFLLNEISKEVPHRSFRINAAQENVPHYDFEQFLSEWERDKKGLVDKLRGRRVAISGEVYQFQRHLETRTPQADIVMCGPKRDTTVVNCLFGDTTPWKSVYPNQRVVILGYYCELESSWFTLTDCTIESVSGEPCPKMTADEFSMELRSGEFSRKHPPNYWDPPHVVVTGIVKAVRKVGNGESTSRLTEIDFATTTDDLISCQFEPTAPRIPKDDEIGREVTVVGIRLGTRPENPALQRCFRMD
ncbi:hypothetical protein [Planctellipticum variicoloris]|uniref:hypothetical protein n=1 Tax=Planctellipticum variicoloris TaxID=3064265 RepID=UPI003013F5D5|nr:hypothetical protein SH412_003911 [Planctomycetaceae bacterium SH412]